VLFFVASHVFNVKVMGIWRFSTVLFLPDIKDVFMFGLHCPVQLVCVGDHRCCFCSKWCIGGKSMGARHVNFLLALSINAKHEAGPAATLFFKILV